MKLPRKFVEWVLWAASLHAHRRVYKLEVKSSDKELLTIKDFVVRVCDAGKCAPRETANVKLAMDEASTNVIRHAYSGKTDGNIEIEGSVGPYDVTFKIRDRGKPFDFRKIKDPDLNHYVEIGRKGGLGIWLIKKVMSQVDYKSQNGVNELIMVRYFDVAPMFGTKADTHATARMRTIPVSVKFTLGAVLMVVMVMVSAYGVLSSKRSDILRKQEQAKIILVLNAVSLEAGESVANRNDLDLNNLLQKITQTDADRLFSYACIVSEDGRYLANNDLSKIFQVWAPPKGLKPANGVGIRIQSIDRVTHYGVPVSWQGRKVGQIWLGLDEKALDRIVQRSVSELRTMLVWGLALSVIAIWLLSLMITRPIQKIFAGVRALHSGDLSAKILLDSQDEFGELASIFNEMTAKIQASQKRYGGPGAPSEGNAGGAGNPAHPFASLVPRCRWVRNRSFIPRRQGSGRGLLRLLLGGPHHHWYRCGGRVRQGRPGIPRHDHDSDRHAVGSPGQQVGFGRLSEGQPSRDGRHEEGDVRDHVLRGPGLAASHHQLRQRGP
jgi:anti-sigma regulatory factor (Ser/Thr protein kinase)/HAMP domain-containing protein